MYKVLLVEDEKMIRKGLAYNFDWIGCDCTIVGEAGNGEEGVEMIRSLNPDIVVTDVGMPIKNGIQMLEETMEAYGYEAIILSVYDEFHYAKAAMHLGVAEYLIKPLEYEQLKKALEKAKAQCRMKQHFSDAETKTREALERDVFDFKIVLPEQSYSPRTRVMVTYISDNYQKKISINDLIEPLQTSATYLNQLFKKETGFPFNDFLNRYRIQMAIQKLKEDDCKIYNVAVECGFKEYKYFINVFKKYTGILPSAFVAYYQKKGDS